MSVSGVEHLACQVRNKGIKACEHNETFTNVQRVWKHEASYPLWNELKRKGLDHPLSSCIFLSMRYASCAAAFLATFFLLSVA